MLFSLISAMSFSAFPNIDTQTYQHKNTHDMIILAQAEDRWGVADLTILKDLQADLLNILEGPVESSRDDRALSAQDKAAIAFDPELNEAFRAAPAATLDLIQRIRDAGGLKP
ncbi:MAG: hypothetical protein AB8B94_17240 [Hyphomicrobiales bacterium]